MNFCKIFDVLCLSLKAVIKRLQKSVRKQNAEAEAEALVEMGLLHSHEGREGMCRWLMVVILVTG